MEENTQKKHNQNGPRRPRFDRDKRRFDKNPKKAEQTAPAEEPKVETEAPAVPENEATVEIVGINFRRAGKIYYFAPNGVNYAVGTKVIVETSRGTEMGVVKIANRLVSQKNTVAPLRPITRIATEDDIERAKANKALEESARAIFKRKAAEHKLEMHLVEVEYTFDNSKLVFYFTSEGRVDFRALVKDLASIFHTRIELLQIGIRDETKMMGGLGSCGHPFCCSEFMDDFAQVSIKMAKEQNFSLNSAKISGSCGRLMCCLRFEHEAYEQALLTTPSVGSLVSTQSGEGVVVETRPLLQLVRVKMSDEKQEIKTFACEDVKVTGHVKPRRDKNSKENQDAEKQERENGENGAQN